MTKFFQKIFDQLLNLFFPLECVICDVSGENICEKCLFDQKISAKKMWFSSEKKEDTEISVSSFFLYSDIWVKQLIRKGKYKYSPEIFRMLSFFVLEKITENSPDMIREIFPKNAVFVPVPLHYFRFQKRGYNQSEVMAQVFSEISGIPIVPLIKRVRNTPPQAKCSAEERKQNLVNAFVLDTQVSEKFSGIIDDDTQIILVDDVVSTASTLLEIQKILKKSGYSHVSGLALARGG